ncbi:hypothetical protein HKT27_30705, partial [Pseudomonas aeruginosa]|nr:hypothetical protein [Pseudomonas aeruginosa]
VFGMRLVLDQVKIAAFGVSACEINEAVQQDNVVAAAGEGDGEGQQTGGGQGHTSHGGFLCFIGGVPKRRALVGNTREGVKKLPHNAKDLHF